MDEKVVKKLTDRNFTKKIVGLDTKEEVKKAFKGEGIEISNKDIYDLGDQLSKIVKEVSKLPPEDLGKVSGGINLLWGLVNTTPTAMDLAGNALANPAVLAVGGGIIGGLLNMGAALINRRSAPPQQPPPPQPIVSNEALATGALVIAVVGGTYGAVKLVKSGWFNKKTDTIVKN